MPARWVSALAFAVLAASAPLHAAARAHGSVLARCAAHEPVARGWRAVRAACPGIERSLARLPLAALMPRHWHGRISSADLGALAVLARRYAHGPSSRLPNPVALRATALGLARRGEHGPRPSLWAWLGREIHVWIAPIATLLEHWLRSVVRNPRHRELLDHLLWIVGGILLATTVLAIVLQLRAGGLFGARIERRSRRAHRPRPPPAAAPTPAAADWTALARQPADLLGLLIGALVRTRRLDRERDLTCRELVARVRFDNAMQRRAFARIALLAERERYGPPRPLAVPQAALRVAQTLYAELERPTAHAHREAR